jgi:hypothetical protein
LLAIDGVEGVVFTDIITPGLVAVAGLEQVALLVRMQVMTSPLFKLLLL